MQESNKICVITGCNTGIGKAAAFQLAKMNYNIIMLVRDSEKSRAAFEEIKAASEGGMVDMIFVDLSSQISVKKAAQNISNKYSVIDILINNAGLLKRKGELSVDGIEMTYAVNLIAPFLLTNLLLPLIEKSYAGRIINLTSELYKKGRIEVEDISSLEKFDGSKAYANSKLMVVMNTMYLSKKLLDKNVSVNCVHPGVVATDVMRDYPRWIAKLLNLFISKPENGAKPTVFLASSVEVSKTTGKYFSKLIETPITNKAINGDAVNQVWDFCMKTT